MQDRALAAKIYQDIMGAEDQPALKLIWDALKDNDSLEMSWADDAPNFAALIGERVAQIGLRREHIDLFETAGLHAAQAGVSVLAEAGRAASCSRMVCARAWMPRAICGAVAVTKDRRSVRASAWPA